jgi:hypothetical protein
MRHTVLSLAGCLIILGLVNLSSERVWGAESGYWLGADAGAAPIGEDRVVQFDVSSNSTKLAAQDSVEIWEVSPTGEKKQILDKCAPSPNRAQGVFALTWTFHPTVESKTYFKGFVRREDGSAGETNILSFVFHDATKSLKQLEECMQQIQSLNGSIPKQEITTEQCKNAGGHVEDSMLICGVGEPTPTKVCQQGYPMGPISGLKCHCVCCK